MHPAVRVHAEQDLRALGSGNVGRLILNEAVDALNLRLTDSGQPRSHGRDQYGDLVA